MRRYGHMRVRDLLSREDFSPEFRHTPLVAQFSSMGSINLKWLEELQHSFSQGSCADPGQPASKKPCTVDLACISKLDDKTWLYRSFHTCASGTWNRPYESASLISGPLGKPEDFRVVWPTVTAVRDSNEGWYAGGSIPGAPHYQSKLCGKNWSITCMLVQGMRTDNHNYTLCLQMQLCGCDHLRRSACLPDNPMPFYACRFGDKCAAGG